MRSRINSRFFGSQLSRSMLARRSRSLLGSLFLCPEICAYSAFSAKVLKVVLFLFRYSYDALTSLIQSIGGISAKAANLKAKFWSTALVAFTMTF